MDIIKQKNYYGFTSETIGDYSGTAILENGDWLLVQEDGSGVTPDGRRYVRVSREFQNMIDKDDNPVWYPHETRREYERRRALQTIPYSDLETVGWTADADKPVILADQEE